MSHWEKIGGAQNDGLYRHKKNGKIRFKKKRVGKIDIERSCKTTSLERARKFRDLLMSDLWEDQPLKSKRSTIGEIWPLWEQGIKNTKRANTAASVVSSQKHLKPYIWDLFLDDMTNEWWVNVYIPKKRAEVDKNGVSREKRKFFNDLKWLSMFLKWCDENGKAPTGWRRPRLTDPDPERAAGKAYTHEETDALIQAADWLLLPKIIMGLEHFMRRSEIALLEKAWVDRENRTISLPASVTKIKKARSFPYSERLELMFECLDEKYGKLNSPYVFPSPRNPMKSIGRDGFASSWTSCRTVANVKGRFHDLRHTGLTRAVKSPGFNPSLICDVAGLAIEELQRTYLHFTIDDKRGVENLVHASGKAGEKRELAK